MRWGLIFSTSIMLAAVAPAVQAAEKEPPACAALTFRPISSGLSDGQQNAGVYPSHFGRIEVVAEVKAGEAVDYFVKVNGKRPAALGASVPASVAACAKAKLRGAIGTPPERCVGDRFAVLIDHVGDRRFVLLYAYRGKNWAFCSAGTA